MYAIIQKMKLFYINILSALEHVYSLEKFVLKPYVNIADILGSQFVLFDVSIKHFIRCKAFKYIKATGNCFWQDFIMWFLLCNISIESPTRQDNEAIQHLDLFLYFPEHRHEFRRKLSTTLLNIDKTDLVSYRFHDGKTVRTNTGSYKLRKITDKRQQF